MTRYIILTFDHGNADEDITDAQITAAWEATLAGAGNVGDLADSDEDEGDSDDDEEEEEEEEEEGDGSES